MTGNLVGRGAVGGALGALMTLALLAAPGAARAEDEKAPHAGPWLSIEVPVEIQSDWTVSSDDPAAEFGDTYPTIEPTIILHFHDNLYLETGLTLEPVLDPLDDRLFGDLGLYVGTLQIVYESNGFAFAAGKLTPEFGVGRDRMPGLYGDELASGYELAERIGFTVSNTFDLGAMGEHHLSASTFFLDTSGLSESAFTNRGRTTLAAGGPGNTEDFSSLAVSLTGENVGTEGLGYHLGFARQDSALPGEAAERGLVVALFYAGELAPDLTLAPIGECAFFDNYAAVPGSDATVCSGGVELGHGNWSLAVAGGAARITAPGVPAVHIHVLQLSAGHAFDNGLGIEAGWRRLKENGVVSHTVGVLFSYTFEHEGALAN